MEGYLVNDVDGVLAARGPRDDLPLDQEYIAFDIETTGLHLGTCRMTEIGAIRFRGSEILEEFNTFVDPETTSFGNDLQANFGEFSANPSSRKFGFNLNIKF